MPWVRFADDYLANDKVKDLGPYARLLDVAGIIYSARELRDGQLSENDVRTIAAIAHVSRWKQAVVELCGVGRWLRCTDGTYVIHDYLTYQPSRESVLKERERDRARKLSSSGRNPSGIPPESERNPNAPVPGPVPGIKSPAGPARQATRAPAHESPELVAEHLRRIEQERASRAAPRQPTKRSSETNGET